MADNNYYLEIPKFNAVFKDNTTQEERTSNANLRFNGIPSSSVSVFYIANSNSPAYTEDSSIGTANRAYINALKNTINWYNGTSDKYKYENFANSEVAVVCIPSLFYGKSIKKGSIALDFYYTGTLLAKLEDIRLNGELVETVGPSSGSTAGIALYDEGILLLTGSWALSSNSDNYIYYTNLAGETNTTDNPRWIYWGKAFEVNLASSTFELDFDGVDYVNTITMFTHADKGEFNTSNNKTYLDLENLTNKDFQRNIAQNDKSFRQDEFIPIKNTVKTAYEDVSGSCVKQTFISTIGLYDKDMNLVATAKLANPVKKTDARDYTFKLKLDI